jgi:hypothetical protein
LFEVVEHHTGGETFSADTDTLEHTIATKLVEYEIAPNLSGRLDFVGDDATHEMGSGSSQSGQQNLQSFAMLEGHGLEGGTFTFFCKQNIICTIIIYRLKNLLSK